MEIIVINKGEEVIVKREDGETLLKIPFRKWKETEDSDTICQDCEFYNYCSFSIFGNKSESILDTPNSFEGLICGKIMNRVPDLKKMNIEPEVLYNLIKGKVIKKTVRK